MLSRFSRTSWLNNLFTEISIRWIILTIALALSLAIAWFADTDQKILVLAGIVGIGIVLVFLRWPAAGIVALTGVSILVPFAIGTGTSTSLSLSILFLGLLIGLWLFDLLLLRYSARLIYSRTFIPLILFLFGTVISFINGQMPWFVFAGTASLSAQFGAMGMSFLAAGAFILVAHQITNLQWLQRMTWLFLFIGGLFLVGRIFPPLGSNIKTITVKPFSHSFFWILFVALAFSQGVLNRQLKKPLRVMLLLLVLFAFYIAMFKGQFWSSGWIPPLIAVGVIAWFGLPRFRWILVILGVIALLFFSQKLVNFAMFGNDYSLITRLEAWRIVLDISRISPILGLGPANYRVYTPFYSIMGYSVEFNSHNNYVDIIAQTGILGLILIFWFFIEVGLLGLRLVNRVHEGFPRAYVVGALGALVGIVVSGMLGDWILPFVFNVGLSGFRMSLLGWMFLGGLVFIESITQTDSEKVGHTLWAVHRWAQPMILRDKSNKS